MLKEGNELGKSDNGFVPRKEEVTEGENSGIMSSFVNCIYMVIRMIT